MSEHLDDPRLELPNGDEESFREYGRQLAVDILLELALASHSLDRSTQKGHASEGSGRAVGRGLPVIPPIATTPVSPQSDVGRIVPPSLPTLGFLGNLVQWGESLPGMPMFLWMVAGFVGILVGLPVIMVILSVLGFANRPAARLVATTNCRWTDAAAVILSGSDLRPGQKIDLAAGEAQIVFHRGAVVTLFGPGTLEVLSDNSAKLLVGKLTARAETHNSHGFAVSTPAIALVDLGTEFGVLVSPDGVDEVHVLRGKVQAKLAAGNWSEADAGGSSNPQGNASSGKQNLDPSAILLVANEALRVDANQHTVARQATAWEQFIPAVDDRETFPLWDTGVGVDCGQSDPHWWITAVSGDAKFTPRRAVAARLASLAPHSTGEAGRWITSANPPEASAGCRTTFRTTFDLTGFDPATAIIDGRFMADDWIVEVRLNGKTLPLDNHLYCGWQQFHVGQGFVAGNNTVEMVVENNPALGPTLPALCVQWKGAARRAVKPEKEK